VRAGRPDAGYGLPRVRAQDGVLGDQGPVEVDREGGDLLRETRRELE